jgi:hypothetical protein
LYSVNLSESPDGISAQPNNAEEKQQQLTTFYMFTLLPNITKLMLLLQSTIYQYVPQTTEI